MLNNSRCQVVPLPRQEFGIEINGETRMVWHGGPWAPRPFMYPLVGPSGHGVTRMGHPGAPNHDHHRSVWFAHAKVLGINFWSDVTDARIRQKSWLVCEDGAQQARLAVRLAWYDGHDPAELLEQDVFFTVLPLEKRELLIDIQTTFQPAAEQLELGITNFGFLAVRMASTCPLTLATVRSSTASSERGSHRYLDNRLGGSITRARLPTIRMTSIEKVSPIWIIPITSAIRHAGMYAKTAGWDHRSA